MPQRAAKTTRGSQPVRQRRRTVIAHAHLPPSEPSSKLVVSNEISSLWDRLKATVRYFITKRTPAAPAPKETNHVSLTISEQDIDRVMQLRSNREERLKVVETMRAPFRDIPSEKIEQAVNTAVREVRDQQHT